MTLGNHQVEGYDFDESLALVAKNVYGSDFIKPCTSQG